MSKKFKPIIIFSIILGLILLLAIILGINEAFRQDGQITISEPVIFARDYIKFINPEGKYSFAYPDNWEFAPMYPNEGLRPKEYSKSKSRVIVGIKYFPGVSNTKYQALIMGDHTESNWTEVKINGFNGYFYNLKSENLDTLEYYLGNGTDTVEILFFKYNKFASDDNYDSSKFEEDFNYILNSFTFL